MFKPVVRFSVAPAGMLVAPDPVILPPPQLAVPVTFTLAEPPSTPLLCRFSVAIVTLLELNVAVPVIVSALPTPVTVPLKVTAPAIVVVVPAL